MLGALVLAVAVLLGHVWSTDQVQTLRDDPRLTAMLVVIGLAAVGAVAWLFVRRPALLPLLAAAALPFRIPLDVGGDTANLLLPLYLVVAAGAVAYLVRAVARPRRGGAQAGRARVGARRGAPPLRRAGDVLERPRPGARAGRLLLRPVRRPVRAARAGPVDAAPGRGDARRARRPGDRARRRRLLGVRDEAPAAEPAGHQLEPVRVLLPRQLALLRPEHLRALPHRRDDRRGRGGGVDVALAHRARRRRRPRASCGRGSC